MASQKGEKKKPSWKDRLKYKYRLVFMNDETLEERFTFRLSRLNVFIALGTLTILLIFLTSILIAFTPLREYIPGYSSVGLQKKLYELNLKTDSIEKALVRKNRYFQNLRDVINGKDLSENRPVDRDTVHKYSDIRLKRSAEDSLLRVDVESRAKYNLYKAEPGEVTSAGKGSIGGVLFFTPLKGVITNGFDAAKGHFAVDIVAKENEAIKSVLDGTVIFANWTLETGYVVAIQHSQNIVSIYKHNSAIIVKEGEYVNAGEPVAIIGETGEFTTGPHLHFELWYEGKPVNPKDYISF
ncbi:MAG: M23 family metallopeptidase [Bacteroidota bacterium]|jgi:murein DD-endopeptidase MepM/ murein hydrolase activator NlpD